LCKISDRKWNSRAPLRKNFGVGGAARRESLALIRSILIDSGASPPARKPNCAKYFWAAFASHHVDNGTKFCAYARDFCSRAALTVHARRCKKSLLHRCFCNMRTMCAQPCSAFVYCDVACAVRVVARAHRAQRASHTHVVKLSHVFFHRSVVNGVQCVSIPDRTDATPAMIHG
jgi:hypothetical protein